MAIAYTDGTWRHCQSGGWAVMFRADGVTWSRAGHSAGPSSTYMEVLAVLHALRELSEYPNIRIYTDSKYVQRYFSETIKPLRKRVGGEEEWLLWVEIHKHCVGKKVKCYWVQGHSGNKSNVAADKLAKSMYLAKNKLDKIVRLDRWSRTGVPGQPERVESMGTQSMQQAARGIAAYLHSIGAEISDEQALEVVAQAHGFTDWDQAQAADGSTGRCAKCGSPLDRKGWCIYEPCLYHEWPQSLPYGELSVYGTAVLDRMYPGLRNLKATNNWVNP